MFSLGSLKCTKSGDRNKCIYCLSVNPTPNTISDHITDPIAGSISDPISHTVDYDIGGN